MVRQHHKVSLSPSVERAAMVSEYGDAERAIDILLKRAVDTAVLLWCVRSTPNRYLAFCTRMNEDEGPDYILREETLKPHQALIDEWIDQATSLALDYLPPIEGESIGVRFKEMCDQKIGGIIAYQALALTATKVS